MRSMLRNAAGFEDLLNVQDPAYRFAEIFRTEGFGSRRLAKQRLKLLRRIDAEVVRMLEEGEQVSMVTWGIDYSFVEAYFMGLWALLLNRRAIVVTGRRILLLQIDSRRRLLELKSQVRYSAIEKGSSRLGRIQLVLRNRSRILLTGIPRADRKALAARIQAGRSNTRNEGPVAGRENLCPHCYAAVVGFPVSCDACGGAFKSGTRAGWLSLLCPGLGDLYLGHRSLGALELLGAAATWGFVGLAFWDVALEQGATGVAAMAVVAGPIFAAVHGSDAWITRRTGFKGIYPARRRVRG